MLEVAALLQRELKSKGCKDATRQDPRGSGRGGLDPLAVDVEASGCSPNTFLYFHVRLFQNPSVLYRFAIESGPFHQAQQARLKIVLRSLQ